MNETEGSAPPIAIIWPYLTFAPLPFAVAMAVFGIGTAKALGGAAVDNMLKGFFVTYLLLSGPALALGWLHRRQYRASGRHRLTPLLLPVFGLSVLAMLLLLILPGQQRGPTGQDLAMLFGIVAGGAMSLVLIGFCAVWLIDRWRKAEPA